jgi:NifU-like protein involved in Fe-S cluster formation
MRNSTPVNKIEKVREETFKFLNREREMKIRLKCYILPIYSTKLNLGHFSKQSL